MNQNDSRRRRMVMQLAVPIAMAGAMACNKGEGAGGSGIFSKAKPLRPKVIDDKLLAQVLGEYRSTDKPDNEYFKVTVSAEKIRCNHSNYKDEYTSHTYSVAFAQDGTVLLNAASGSMKIKVDEAGQKFTFEVDGICPWGIDSPYKKIKPLDGKPAELLDPSTPEKREAVSAKVGEELKLPRGSVTLSEVKRATWEDKDGDTPVIELKLAIAAPDSAMIDPFLAADIADVASTEEQVWSVSCDGSDSKGTGNPRYKDHREPKFDTGIYTAFGGHRETIVKPGKTRSGWLVLLMEKKPSGKCTIKFDAVGLGGGIIAWTHSFD